jgi:hypothetical protein
MTIDTELMRSHANRGRLAEIADELRALETVSKKSCNPEELAACARRAAELGAETRELQGRAVAEAGRLIRELQAALPGFDPALLPEWLAALKARLLELERR